MSNLQHQNIHATLTFTRTNIWAIHHKQKLCYNITQTHERKSAPGAGEPEPLATYTSIVFSIVTKSWKFPKSSSGVTPRGTRKKLGRGKIPVKVGTGRGSVYSRYILHVYVKCAHISQSRMSSHHQGLCASTPREIHNYSSTRVVSSIWDSRISDRLFLDFFS